MKYKDIYKILVLIVLILSMETTTMATDYRNFYGVNWVGSACDNIDYAKSMGYDFVNYKIGMENCANNKDIGFYLESPENIGFPSGIWQIEPTKAYTDAQKAAFNDYFLWKSTASFPNNLATGWYFTSSVFRPLPDFQRQEIIDKAVNSVMADIAKKSNLVTNFHFAGFSWDVPNLEGDLWSKKQADGGAQVTIKYWTGSGSGVKHPGKTYQYATYADGQAAFKKKLFATAKLKYPNMKTIIEPWLPYESYVEQVSARSDKAQLLPDFILEESAGVKSLNFINDGRLFSTGLMTKSKMGSSTPNIFSHLENLKIAGNAAVAGAWFTWFGRFGGTGDMPSYSSVTAVPARLKLIRAMVGWDNLNYATSKLWNATTYVYKSSLSYADQFVIYSTHYKNKMLYTVVLDKDKSTITVPQSKTVSNIYSTDTLFRKATLANSDFSKTVTNGVTKLKLLTDANEGKGYIIETK